MGYDAAHKKADHIFRLTTTSPDFAEGNHFARIFDSEKLPILSEQVPEIENFVRLMPLRDRLLLKQEQHYTIEQAYAVDDTFLDIFDITFLEGDRNTAFDSPGSAVISASLARTIFGAENPIDQIFSLPTGHFNTLKADFTIKGVMEDFEQQSHLHPDLLVMPGPDAIRGWAYVYLLLKKNVLPDEVVGKLSKKLNELYTEESGNENKIQAHLTNLKEIHLKSNLLREIEPNGTMSNIYLLAISSLILLFISLSNFTSLNLGMAAYLSKFLALNQILGSSKRIMATYFIIESAIIVFAAVVLVVLASFQLNTLILDQYQMNLTHGNGWFVLAIIMAFCFLGILAGIQPVIKSRFENFTLGKTINGNGSVHGHKVLLVAQFTLAVILLVGVIVISKQTDFALSNSMGAKEDNILCIPYVHAEVQKDFDVFKSELLKQSAIISVSAMLAPPGGETNDMFSFTMQDVPDEEDNTIGVFSCDYSFAEVFGLTFLSGRNFTESNKDEIENGEYIINETALHYLGFQDANAVLDKSFALISPVENVVLPQGRIIGVVKDFHLSGLQTKVEPLALFKRENSWLSNIAISHTPTLKNEAIEGIQKVWMGMFPKYPLEYTQVSALYQKVYKTELLQKNLIFIFALIAVFVCAMGVLGLSLMVSQRRFKEIGIRKVNGATISEILIMLNSDFLKWLLLAILLATPIAYFAAKKWLEAFAYKIEIDGWMFLLAGSITITITILTVSWHSYQAAKQNPVKSLRRE